MLVSRYPGFNPDYLHKHGRSRSFGHSCFLLQSSSSRPKHTVRQSFVHPDRFVELLTGGRSRQITGESPGFKEGNGGRALESTDGDEGQVGRQGRRTISPAALPAAGLGAHVPLSVLVLGDTPRDSLPLLWRVPPDLRRRVRVQPVADGPGVSGDPDRHAGGRGHGPALAPRLCTLVARKRRGARARVQAAPGRGRVSSSLESRRCYALGEDR